MIVSNLYIYTLLNERDKVHKYYSSLKMIRQANLNVGFFIKCAKFKQFYLYVKLLQSNTNLKKKS